MAHEPAGFTELTDRPFAAKVEEGWLDRGDAAFTIETPSSPDGDNSVGQALFPTGYVPGSGPINTYYPVTGSRTKLYVRIRGFRVDSGWYGHSATGINKIMFVWHGSGPGIYVQVKGATTNTLYFRVNTQMPSAIQTRDYELGQASAGGVDYECVRGTFYDIELLCEENLVGSQDTGRIRMWVKESSQADSSYVLVADSNVEVPTYDAGAFDGLIFWDVGQSRHFDGELRWNPTYGGGGGDNVPDDQYQQIDAIYVSASSATSDAMIAFDAFTASSAIATSLTYTHTPVGSPQGVIVFAILPLAGNDLVTSVTYGGIAMARVAISRKTSGEAMNAAAYFLGANVPTGSRSVVITCSGAAVIVGYSTTVTATTDMEVIDSDATINSDSTANPSVTLGLTGREAFCAIGLTSGQDAHASVTPLAGWTSRAEGELGGTAISACYTYDTVDSLDVTAGWTQAAEDAVAVALAIGEVQAAAGGVFQDGVSRHRRRLRKTS